jgi:hypothetical protein
MMVQQPNLDMLNPMMDDFLNKISEPMELEGKLLWCGLRGQITCVLSHAVCPVMIWQATVWSACIGDQ